MSAQPSNLLAEFKFEKIREPTLLGRLSDPSPGNADVAMDDAFSSPPSAPAQLTEVAQSAPQLPSQVAGERAKLYPGDAGSAASNGTGPVAPVAVVAPSSGELFAVTQAVPNHTTPDGLTRASPYAAGIVNNGLKSDARSTSAQGSAAAPVPQSQQATPSALHPHYPNPALQIRHVPSPSPDLVDPAELYAKFTALATENAKWDELQVFMQRFHEEHEEYLRRHDETARAAEREKEQVGKVICTADAAFAMVVSLKKRQEQRTEEENARMERAMRRNEALKQEAVAPDPTGQTAQVQHQIPLPPVTPTPGQQSSFVTPPAQLVNSASTFSSQPDSGIGAQRAVQDEGTRAATEAGVKRQELAELAERTQRELQEAEAQRQKDLAEVEARKKKELEDEAARRMKDLEEATARKKKELEDAVARKKELEEADARKKKELEEEAAAEARRKAEEEERRALEFRTKRDAFQKKRADDERVSQAKLREKLEREKKAASEALQNDARTSGSPSTGANGAASLQTPASVASTSSSETKISAGSGKVDSPTQPALAAAPTPTDSTYKPQGMPQSQGATRLAIKLLPIDSGPRSAKKLPRIDSQGAPRPTKKLLPIDSVVAVKIESDSPPAEVPKRRSSPRNNTTDVTQTSNGDASQPRPNVFSSQPEPSRNTKPLSPTLPAKPQVPLPPVVKTGRAAPMPSQEQEFNAFSVRDRDRSGRAQQAGAKKNAQGQPAGSLSPVLPLLSPVLPSSRQLPPAPTMDSTYPAAQFAHARPFASRADIPQGYDDDNGMVNDPRFEYPEYGHFRTPTPEARARPQYEPYSPPARLAPTSQGSYPYRRPSPVNGTHRSPYDASPTRKRMRDERMHDERMREEAYAPQKRARINRPRYSPAQNSNQNSPSQRRATLPVHPTDRARTPPRPSPSHYPDRRPASPATPPREAYPLSLNWGPDNDYRTVPLPPSPVQPSPSLPELGYPSSERSQSQAYWDHEHENSYARSDNATPAAPPQAARMPLLSRMGDKKVPRQKGHPVRREASDERGPAFEREAPDERPTRQQPAKRGRRGGARGGAASRGSRGGPVPLSDRIER